MDYINGRIAFLLKTYLDGNNFKIIYSKIVMPEVQKQTPFGLNNENIESFRWHIKECVSLGGNKNALIELLLYPHEMDRELFTCEELEIIYGLQEYEYISIGDKTVINTKIQLIMYEDEYIIIDARLGFKSEKNSDTYIGVDTFYMLQHIKQCKLDAMSNVLDLCTGTGIAAIYASRAKVNAEAIDIDVDAIKLAIFNRNLNKRNVIIEQKDLREKLKESKKYDLVISNPPFVPVIDGCVLPIYAQGCESDGLGYYRVIIEHIKPILTHTGKCILVGDFAGNDEYPFFYEELKKYSDEFKLDIYFYTKAINDGMRYIKGYPKIIQKFNKEISMELLEEKTYEHFVDKLNMKKMYLGIIEITHASSVGTCIYAD